MKNFKFLVILLCFTSFISFAQPCPVATASPDETLCSGGTTNVSLTSDIILVPTTFTWTVVETNVTGAIADNGAVIAQTLTATGTVPGIAVYTITPNANGCDGTPITVTITVNPLANAGSPGSTTVCDSSTTPIDLFSLITGEQSGGTWVRSSGTAGTFNAAAGTFTPAIGATTSTFTYTINGTAPCVDDSSVATITINAQPNAGSAGSTTTCDSSSAAIDLFSLITGEQSGGTWVRSSGTGGTFNAAGGTFTPAPGAITSTFTYTIIGTSPCVDDSSVATIMINAQPNAGSAGNTTICDSSSASIDLFSLISGEQSGGTWVRSSGTGGTFNAAGGTFTPAPGATTSTFTYTITGTAPCVDDSSIATITINAQPNAGSAGSTTICDSSSAVIDLFSLITGEQSGGTWVRSSGTGGTFNAAGGTFTPAPGAITSTFTYTIIGTSPCVDDSSVATITINAQPNAGSAGSTTICDSSSASIDLFSLISGEQSGGTWVRSSGTGGTFNAGAGTYTPAIGAITSTFTYTITGTAPCVNDSSVATITINAQPNAGSAGSTTICDSSSASIDLFSLISGEQSGGTWVRSSGTGGTFNAGAGTYTPAIGAITSTFTYTITGTAPCVNDSSIATITINAQPNAGSAGNTTICDSSSAAIDLFSLISGEQSGGTWVRSSGTGGTFNAGAGTFTPAPGAITSTFTYTITGTAPCVNDSSVATITINAQPNAGSAGNTTICDSSSASIDLFSLISGEQSGGTWVRSSGTGGTFNAGAGTYTPAIGAITSTFTYTIIGTAPCVNSSSVATITINPTPNAIATNGIQSICSGTAMAIMVISGVVPSTTFNWTRDNTVAVTGIAANGSGNISGTLTNTTNATITVTFTITPTANGCVGTPITTTVAVKPTPNVSATNSSQTICSAASITTMVLSGNVAGTTFNWTRDNSPAVTGIATSGSGNISGSLTNTTNAPITVTFTITPTASACNGTAITATVLVNPTPNASATNSAQTICSGIAITPMVITGSVASTTFNWTRNNTATATGIAASGSGNISGTLTNTTTANVIVTFTITPTANGCPGTPITATVTVKPTPTASATNASQTICSGSSISTMTISGSVAGTTFNWTRDNSPAVTGIATSGSGNISGSLTNTTNAPITVTFTITPTAAGCTGIPTTATVLVNPIPNASATNSAQTICSGIAITTMVITGSVASTTFNWTRNNTATATGIAASGSGNISGTLTNTTTTNVIVTFTITPTANGCPGTPITAIVTVKPTPTASATNASQTICSGSNISTMTISGTVSGTTYNWTRDNMAAVTGIAANGTGNISGSLTNTTNAGVTVTFTIIPTANGCSGVPITTTVLVKPKPDAIATSSSQNACSGSPISTIVLTSGVAGTTFTWTRNTPGGITGIPNSGSGNISGTLTNSTNAPIIVTFTITPTATLCPGNNITATVTVNPKPTVAATNSAQTICSGNSITAMVLSGNVAGTVFNWTRDNTVAVNGIAASGSGNISGTLTNTTSANVTVTFTITPIANGCAGNPVTTTVIVKPIPNVAATNGSQTVCSNDPITTMVLSSSTAGTTYTWTRNNTINVTGIAASGSGDISGTLNNITTAPITVTFTITPTSNGCVGTPITATVAVISSTDGGVVTPALTTSCAPASGILTLSSYLGTILRWESSTNGGNTWTTIPGPITTTTYNYSGINQTTIFRAVVENTSFCPIAYSETAVVNAIPMITPNPVTAAPSTICAGDSSILTALSGYATSQNLATGGAFNNSNPPGWLVDGCGNCLNASGSNGSPGPFVLSASNGTSYSGIVYLSGGKFAIANGNFNSIMQTPAFSTVGLTTATLQFNHAFNLVGSSWVRVELSLDGGASYNIVLAEYFATSTRTPYNNFPLESIDLSSYIGQTNLKVRFNYHGSAGSSWAVDNIQIPDVPVGLNTQWIDTSNGQIISMTTTATVSPIVTTTYTISTTINNGCPGGSASVTVTVNPRPTATFGTAQTVCNGSTATVSITFTGTAPWTMTYTNGTTPTTVTTSLNPYVFSVPNVTSNVSYSITALRDLKCIAIGADFAGTFNINVLNGTPGLWTGNVSTDWFDCLNWSGGLPSSTVNAMINAGSPRMPLIDRSSPFAAAYGFIASAQDLIINPSTSLTVASTNNSELRVSRDWKNNGTFTPGTGTVTFNGATSNLIQTINAGIKTQETFYNMTVNTSNGAKGVSVATGFELTVINALSLLSGDLRLTGEAQLVQNGTAANPLGGTGKLLADQQGTKSSWRYNYWSAPVSTDGSIYTVGGILRDGTDVVSFPFNPVNIVFGNYVTFADGVATSPIKISASWIFKYTAVSNAYAAWQPIGSTGSVKIGEGFTMKGTDGLAAFLTNQNYVFYGKPNSGTITLNISLAQSYLIGNPYPCALNADTFIMDNIKDGGNATSNIFNGALYFWDHFGGQTHLLNEYVGGYATYSLMGGAVAIANDPLTINNNSTGTKVPGKFIPVGQGFFIGTILDPLLITNNPGLTSAITGGPVVFKNTQRLFKTEISGSSVFFRNQNGSTTATDLDNRPKIRLRFISPSGVQRQLLLGADYHTTNLFDLGYDAPMIDLGTEDMYWELANSKFVIQAVNDFNSNQDISIGIKVANAGLSTIKIDYLENIGDETPIYIYDNFTGLYHDLKNGDFTASLPIGEHNNRFSVRFSEVALDVNQNNATGIEIIHIQNGNQLLINNSLLGETVTKINLINLMGQAIETWDVENSDQQNIQIPIKNISVGTYVVRINTSSGTLSKKIIIKQ